MATIQQLTYLGPRHLEWQEVNAPRIEHPEEALVEPLAVARCDLDLYIAMGLFPMPGPFAFGHEMTGRVTEIGDAVESVSVGDRVIVPFQINCGTCVNCKRGWTNACTKVPPTAAFGLRTNREIDFGGAFSDSVRIPFADAMLMPLPEGMSPETGCGLGDNVADGFRTVAPWVERFPEERVLVVGGLGQSVGLYAVHSAIALGAPEVTYTDYDDTRLALAEAAGATAVKTDYGSEKRATSQTLITVDATGMPEGLAFAIRSTAPCGFLTSISGGLTPSTEIPLNEAYRRGLNYSVGRVHSRRELPSVIELVTRGELDPLALMTKKATFDDAVEAIFDPSPKVIFTRS